MKHTQSTKKPLHNLGYSKNQIDEIINQIVFLFEHKKVQNLNPQIQEQLKQGSPLFVAYPDQMFSKNASGIKLLDIFIKKYFKDMPVYILPPWQENGDGGFCIIDYEIPRKTVGTSEDLVKFCKDRPVSLDVVYTNISAKHVFVSNHLKTPYVRENSIVAEFINMSHGDIPTSHRGHPNIRKFRSKFKDRWLWTTFSPEQVNLNYSSPKTLIWLLTTIASYLDLGAESIRLDAVPFSWTIESGTVLHAQQCHELIKVVRSFIDLYRPKTLLIAQADYDSKPLHDYIGDSNQEAHLLYRHELSPIILHAILANEKKYLEQWINKLNNEVDSNWISFLSTCDGIFLRPWNYPLPLKGIKLLATACEKGGGVTQYYHWKSHPPATLCTTTFSLLHYKKNHEETVKRLILAYAILLALPGIPSLFFNSVLGLKNWTNWKKISTEARTIVREKYSAEFINKKFNQPKSTQRKIYNKIKPLINLRIRHKAFSQNSKITINKLKIKNVISWSMEKNNLKVICFFNLGYQVEKIKIKKNMKYLIGVVFKDGILKLKPLTYSWMEVI